MQCQQNRPDAKIDTSSKPRRVRSIQQNSLLARTRKCCIKTTKNVDHRMCFFSLRCTQMRLPWLCSRPHWESLCAPNPSPLNKKTVLSVVAQGLESNPLLVWQRCADCGRISPRIQIRRIFCGRGSCSVTKFADAN